MKNYVKSKVAQYCALRGMSIDDLAKRTGMSMSTVYNKIKKPETMKIWEFKAIMDKLGMTREDKAEMIRMLIAL